MDSETTLGLCEEEVGFGPEWAMYLEMSVRFPKEAEC